MNSKTPILWLVLLFVSALASCTTTVVIDGKDAAQSDAASFHVVGGDSDNGVGGGTTTAQQMCTNACASDEACVGQFGTLAVCSAARCNLSTGCCEVRPEIEGVSCNDGDACTTQDVCTNNVCDAEGCRDGVCLGSIKTCDDGNPCTHDSCSGGNGQCIHAPTSPDAGVQCDDGNLCTVDDGCAGGICTGAANPICACNLDSDCDQFDDGDLCNGVLQCGGEGLCVMVAGSQVQCDYSQAGPCQTVGCNAKTGVCETQSRPNGTLCNDGNACTQFDLCSGGFCVGQPVLCEDHNLCTDDTCDPVVGCAFAPVAVPCDDGDLCTVNDTCMGGICAGTQNPGCQCETTADCAQFEDGNLCNGTLVCTGQSCLIDPESVVSCAQQAALAPVCQDVICDPTSGICVTKPSLDGTPCQDTSVCTTVDYCTGGACAGLQDTCDDGNPCTQDSCDPGTGCKSLPLTGIPCDDANYCTANDLCMAGKCEGTPNENNASCQCFSDQDCIAFEDGNFCNGTLHCEDNNCKVNPNTVIACPDAGPCNVTTCYPQSGQCLTSPKPNGAPCNDGTACTKSDHCSAGYCVGTPISCDDGDICTDDICNPQIGCTHEYGLSFCDDGNECTTLDACFFGNCQGFTLETCTCNTHADCNEFDDGNKCNGTLICKGKKCVTDSKTVVHCPAPSDPDCGSNQCNPTTGKCNPVSAQNNKPCDDGSACTTNDRCQGGQCVGTPTMNCSDGNPCTKDLCQPGSGCYHPMDNGAPCDDGDPCTANDLCNNGACVPGPATAACNGTCVAAKALSCGSTEMGGTGNQGSTDSVDQYSCGAGTYSGREFTYTFVAPYTGSFEASLSNESGVTDVFILAPSSTGCNPNACIDRGFTSAQATMTAGQTYYVIVDSNNAWSSNYTMTLSCASNGESKCDDNIDNDQDGKVDCSDSDCAASASCQQAAAGCAQSGQLSCGATDSASTNSGTATDAVDVYSGCNNNYNYTNKEYAYQFTATSSGTVTVQLTNVSADLDVGVLDAAGGCKGSSCIVWGDNSVTFSAVAGKSYYLVVDGYNGVQGSFNIHVNCGTVTESNCVDNIDNDSDGQIDCADSDCNGFPACGTPPSESNCTDSWDNDSDGKTDCDDPDCAGHASCTTNSETNCSDMVDNDGDGAFDCSDSDCSGTPACAPQSETSCVNGTDDDGDFLVDCNDSDCANSPACTSSGVEKCANDKDDDGDGAFDCEDSDCFGHSPDCEPACVATENTYQTLTCPNDTDHWNISSFGSTTGISRYSCTAITYDGPEFAYRYTAQTTGQVTVSLTLDETDLDLLVLRDTGLGCNPASCQVWAESTATWQATAGETYYVVLEGYNTTSGEYDLTFTCGN